MQSDWLDATLHLSIDELRVLNWMEAPMIPDEDLTNPEECDIMVIEE